MSVAQSFVDTRHVCQTCRAIFRQRFARCPLDGSELVRSDDDPLIGVILAERYVIEDCVGEGGMGRVYRARHTRMSRRFAIKVLYGDLAADETSRQRFEREAEAASRLQHPNLVSVVDFGQTTTGLLYLAMELVGGSSLRQLINEQAPFEVERATNLLRQLASGLEHAHDRGLVHRDFKPDNVLITHTADGELAKILDFGIARIVEEGAGKLTTDGMVMGTPAFMSPEQASGKAVDHRTDLFALGMTMYEMLAGKLPFDGDPMAMLSQNLVMAPPAMSERAGFAVDAQLEAIAAKLLGKRPEQRYQSVRDVISAIDTWWESGARRQLVVTPMRGGVRRLPPGADDVPTWSQLEPSASDHALAVSESAVSPSPGAPMQGGVRRPTSDGSNEARPKRVAWLPSDVVAPNRVSSESSAELAVAQTMRDSDALPGAQTTRDSETSSAALGHVQSFTGQEAGWGSAATVMVSAAERGPQTLRLRRGLLRGLGLVGVGGAVLIVVLGLWLGQTDERASDSEQAMAVQTSTVGGELSAASGSKEADSVAMPRASAAGGEPSAGEPRFENDRPVSGALAVADERTELGAAPGGSATAELEVELGGATADAPAKRRAADQEAGTPPDEDSERAGVATDAEVPAVKLDAEPELTSQRASRSEREPSAAQPVSAARYQRMYERTLTRYQQLFDLVAGGSPLQSEVDQLERQLTQLPIQPDGDRLEPAYAELVQLRTRVNRLLKRARASR